jgi:hypothetical protein
MAPEQRDGGAGEGTTVVEKRRLADSGEGVANDGGMRHGGARAVVEAWQSSDSSSVARLRRRAAVARRGTEESGWRGSNGEGRR